MKRLYEEVGEGQGYAAVGFSYKDEKEADNSAEGTGVNLHH